jgi:hypothetical protein
LGQRSFRRLTSDNKTLFAGDIFAADLQALNADLQSRQRVAPAVLLMDDTARVYHDRFLVVDDVVWHFGHSFNRVASDEVSMAARLLHPEEMRTLILQDIGNAAPFLTAWPTLRMRRQAHRESFWPRLWRVIKMAAWPLTKDNP